jgi:SsrA-binding protein
VPKPAETGRKVVATNRRARYDYDILETFECGLVLQGSEVKSLRAGQVQLKDSYAELRGAELWLANAHIAPYQFARDGGHEP